MSLESWLAFTAACVVLTLIPGPSVLLVVSQAVVRGKAAALMCILGDVLGGVVLMALSFLGVGAVLAASALLFQVVKWAGVLYLAYLGCRQILDARNGAGAVVTGSAPEPFTPSSWMSFWAGAVTAVLNPKAIMFYLAFLAQFVDLERSIALQVAIMTATSSAVVVVFLGFYALIATRARRMFHSPAAHKRIGYTGGACMLGGSVVMAATR
ncbi:LysE family translocator [Breoghania sp. L-A4]|uniref:LysE family translocator n=1 Tax=Breoghania sp. L-A4 TaxID=2304600 RepID=UPI000E35ED2D|nr:LysE family translocator [Breoghania sp. L-A4]AXS40574.1 LysE family translocator [Breoghania sp. L-A4]